MKINCIIISYNAEKKICEVYDSIKRQVDEVIIIDNGSNLRTIQFLKKIEKQKNIQVIYNKKNLGIATALNQGIKTSIDKDADFILTLDHDSIAPKNMVGKMLEIYNTLEEAKIGIMCPAIYDIRKKGYLTDVGKEQYQKIKEPIQSGAMISRKVFEKIGYYNEDLFIYYVDTEFCYRALESSFEFIQCNEIMLKHEEGNKTIHNILRKKLYYNNYGTDAIYYRSRNNIYMIKKYGKRFSSKYVILKDFIKILAYDKNRLISIKSHFEGIKDGIFNKLGKK